MNIIVPPMRQCTKCFQEFPATTEYFYRSKAHTAGIMYQCKKCHYGRKKEITPNVVARQREANWRKSEKGKAYLAAKEARKRNKHPEQHRARVAVATEVKFHRMLSIGECSCAKCGAQAEAYHHWSYEKQYRLDVIPLCRSCHNNLHRMNKVVRAKLESKLRTNGDLKKAA